MNLRLIPRLLSCHTTILIYTKRLIFSYSIFHTVSRKSPINFALSPHITILNYKFTSLISAYSTDPAFLLFRWQFFFDQPAGTVNNFQVIRVELGSPCMFVQSAMRATVSLFSSITRFRREERHLMKGSVSLNRFVPSIHAARPLSPALSRKLARANAAS